MSETTRAATQVSGGLTPFGDEIDIYETALAELLKLPKVLERMSRYSNEIRCLLRRLRLHLLNSSSAVYESLFNCARDPLVGCPC